MTSKDVSDKLATLVASHKQTVHLIHRLLRLPVQPGNASLSEGTAVTELTAEIHQALKEEEEELELLRQEADSLPVAGRASVKSRNLSKEQEEERIKATVAKLAEDLRTWVPGYDIIVI